MGSSTISLGLGLGGGKAATSSGTSGGGSTPFTNQYSVSFDGTNDYIQLPNGVLTALSGTAYSISMWYKLNQEGYYIEPFSAGGTTGDRILTYFRARGSGTVSIEFYAGSATHLIEASPFQSINTWNNAVITVDTGGTSSLYVNGALKAHSVNVPQTTPTNPVIGCLDGVSNFLDGKIDEVAIFNSALTASQITNIYKGEENGGSGGTNGVPGDLSTFSPVNWWRMGDNDGGTGTTITDQGSGGNDGTLTNGPTYSTSVPS